MRNIKTLVIDIAKKPPLMFPFIGAFHILWLLWIVIGLRGESIGYAEIIRVIWMIAYCFFWLAACDLKRWGALGYFGLALLNAILYFSLRAAPVKEAAYTSSIFIIDDLCSFILLFYYKIYL